MILDMGASFGLPNEEEYFDLMPSAYFKNIAMGAINYALGGVVAGIYRPEIVNSKWTGSNQGSFMVVIDAGRLQPLAAIWRAAPSRTRPFQSAMTTAARDVTGSREPGSP